MNSYDVVVVGGGAAGLSAALVLTRARRSVLVIDAGEPRNAAVTHMHGFLSRDGMPPSDFLALGRTEVSGYGGEVRRGFVATVASAGSGGFQLVLDDGEAVVARRALVATGLRDEIPAIPGLSDRWGRDVLHCPYCHGYEVRDQPLGVLGGSSDAVRYAQIVRQWTTDLTYFTPSGTLSSSDRDELANRGIEVVEGTIEQVVVDSDRMRGVRLDDGCVIPRAALFVPPRFVPNSALLVALGCEVDHEGWTSVDSSGRTSVPGVWAAGNVVNARAQVITAAGEGSAAAIAINADLVAEDVNAASRPPVTDS